MIFLLLVSYGAPMTLKESAPPSIPVPRESTERPLEPPGLGGVRRPLRTLNALVGALAATVLIVAYLGYRRHHPNGLDLDAGFGDLSVIIAASVALAYTLGNLVIKPYTGVSWRLWASSLWFGLLCLLTIAGIWTLVYRDNGRAAIPGTEVGSPAQVQTYLDRALGAKAAALPHIPTGAFVQSVEFSGANDVKVSGYLWQRYARNVPAGLKRGVALPEAGDAYSTK